MQKQKYIVWFEEVNKGDIGLVGGKGANLGEMTNAHLPIPYGFIVTSHAYFLFIKESNLQPKINELLKNINCENPHELHQASIHIQELILRAPIPEEFMNQIIEYYADLPLKEEQYLKRNITDLKKGLHKIKSLYVQPLVAVRSSATAEDLPGASFAGQQDTYLNVKGDQHLLHKVRECWASLFTERAIYYRHNQGFDHFKVGLAAVVQRMAQSDKSGIAFSIDPVTNDKTKIVIEAIYGLGEYIVQGKVTPDHYEVDKRSFIILKKDIKFQNLKYIKAGIDNKEVRLSREEGSQKKLSDEEIIKVALLVKEIEHHYYFPQDIEWAIEKDKVFIVQSRPITTIKGVDAKNSSQQVSTNTSLPLVTGAPASPGIGIGPVKIIHSPHEIDRVKKGDVLVAPQTNPDYVPAMKKAIAIVTEKGGRTSHAAIVSRELGIPAVVGAENATYILKNEMIVSVNGQSGEVFKGSILNKTKLHDHEPHDIVSHRTLHTKTKVYVNLAEPEQAEKIAKRDCDGIGLLRAEFMIAEIGTHPKEFIKHHRQHEFINRLTHDLEKFVKPFSPRNVVYRATDFKTNEYRHLKGGKAYEPQEENPMLGFRGASRYIANPDIFAMELQAIKNIWEKGYNNLHLMIPFVRAPWELIKIKEIVNEFGLMALPGFKLWIMVEVPACALALEEFIKIGIDGVSIGTNDLTMMLLGVDRDNQEVANVYDERTPVVMSVLEYIVKTCAEHGVTCSICGQAASDYPDMVEKLVHAGITSVSINPDAIERTRELIHMIESKVYKPNGKSEMNSRLTMSD
ncbi:MAG: phosphoenolpyruvate synthase [bacterium]|nr:phosphoenolpyruvate synthase [bacterium]